jgi:CHRD domain-containing protein
MEAVMKYRKTVMGLAAIPLLTMPLVARHNDGHGQPEREFRAELRGRNEVPLTLSGGKGTLALTVNDDDTSVHFVLEYSGLLTPVGASHIHVGQPNVNGSVTVFFCGTVPAGFPARLACPPGAGTVAGDFTAADVIGLTSQQLEAHNLPKLLAAIRAGKTYANVHTTTSPGGEIRGQIHNDEKKE